MEPKNIRFGGTTPPFPPIAYVLLAITFVLLLAMPRKYLPFAFIVAGIIFPLQPSIVIAGLHFMTLRVLTITCWLRILHGRFISKKEPPLGRLNSIDRVFILWALASATAFSLLYHNAEAVTNQMGFLLNAFGIYFLLRFLIRDAEGARNAVKAFAVAAVLVAACMVSEQATGRNLFGVFGVLAITPVREGLLRSQASFEHSILAGNFGATLFPVFVGLWVLGKKYRKYATVGIVASIVITFTSVSSTPVVAFLAAIMGLCLWPIRKGMRWVRWGIVLMLIALQIVMKAPVWALISHVDIVPGNSSWHRYALVDQFIRHFKDWWLVGTADNGSWGWDMWDQANEFVAQGETGGLLTLVLFITMIVRAFRSVGKAREASESDTRNAFFFWALGVAVFAHILAFMGISYFDQTILEWFALLAIIGAATATQADSLALAPAAEKTKTRPELLLAYWGPSGMTGVAAGPVNFREASRDILEK